jgi:sugar phosphate isomerase/epimerase
MKDQNIIRGQKLKTILLNNNKMKKTKRRDFIKGIALSTIALALPNSELFAKKKSKMKMGLVTYQWGKDWDIPTIIQNCERSKVLGVELRTQHKHGVEPSLSSRQRKEIKKRFADSSVTLLGYGSNVQFDNPDPAVVRQNINQAKELLKLTHDIGSSGLKVKPNQFHEGVPHEKTLEQIGRSLNEVGEFAEGLGQQVRLEAHGRGTNKLPNIKAIMDIANNPNVTVCWNSNTVDTDGKGLEYNFNLVKDRFGDIVHIHELNLGNYPYQELMNLLVKMDYSGWLLLECSSDPEDKVKAMIDQRKIMEKMLANA